jgi:hypothetical protein
MRDARRRRAASRVRVLACVAPCVAPWATAGGGEGRLRSNAAVARMNLGILASFSGAGGFPLSYLAVRNKA